MQAARLHLHPDSPEHPAKLVLRWWGVRQQGTLTDQRKEKVEGGRQKQEWEQEQEEREQGQDITHQVHTRVIVNDEAEPVSDKHDG